MLGPEHEALAKQLAQARDEARESQKRCTDVAGSFNGKKTAILERLARSSRKPPRCGRRTLKLAADEDPNEEE
jgi:hypothetical protein